jgi:hypothetical protein
MKKITYLLICMFILGVSLIRVSQKADAQVDPGISPTSIVSSVPTAVPTSLPTEIPTALPTAVPTAVPTVIPTAIPTALPTVIPTVACSPVPTSTGTVTTTITLGSSAKYAIWSRIMAPNTNAASYYLVIDDQCGIKVGGNSLRTYAWTWVGYSDGLPANRVILDITKGSHVVKLIGDSPNLGVDKVIFTPDMSCVPTGSGSNCNQVITPTVVATASGTPTTSQTGTTVPTGAVIPTVTGPIPTDTPAPTATPVPGTQFAVTVLIHGVGHGGDNAAPDSQGNRAPIHIQRTAAIQLYDSNNVLIASPTGTVTFDPHDGTYKGIIAVGRALPAGAYITKIVISRHLNKSAVKILTITNGEANPIPLDAVQMVAGDLNGDGKLTILDFNTMMGCLSDLGPAKACDATAKGAADLNDDGIVDLADLNLYFRELSVQSGE